MTARTRYREGMERRRAALAADVQARYDITLHPHPRMPHTVIVSESDYASLERQVIADRRLDAIGRGYYLYLGSELDVITAPDWACNPVRVARLRAEVITIYRPAKRLLRRILGVTR